MARTERPETPIEEKDKLNYFQKLWRYRKYLVVEPFVFFYVMASIFNSVAMLSFPLEKACHVNLGYDDIVCRTMLDKGKLDINCGNLSFENRTMGAIPDDMNLTVATTFNYTVCKAEIESQKLAADVSGSRAQIAAIFPLIVLLFAGGWSDRYNKRKPCMLFPIIGEMLSFSCLLISAIFFDSIPMEFGAFCEAIIPNLFGGSTFCLMAIYSYITIATPEEDRLFRFGIFAMFISAIPFIGQPFSGYIFQKLGYVLSFAMGMSFQLIAIFYIIFFIKEVNASKKDEGKQVAEDLPPPLPTNSPPPLNGVDNMSYEMSNVDDVIPNKNVTFEIKPQTETPPKHEPPKEFVKSPRKSFLKEFFDLTLVRDCIRFPMVKRKNRGRLLLILLIIAYFLTVGPTLGENDFWYGYELLKLKWNGNDFSTYTTFSAGASLLGTFIGTAIFSKLFNFSDPTIGIISAMAIVCSRIIFAFATDTTSFYIGGVVDMFISLRAIAIKSIASGIVDGEELSKMYSIFGISEPIGQFVFTPILSAIYKKTVDTFPGAIFLFGEIFYIPNVLVFVLCYFILRRNKRKNDKTKEQSNSKGTTNGHTNSDCEITSL